MATEVSRYPAMDRRMGCGLIGGIFAGRKFWLRRTPVHSLPHDTSKSYIKHQPSTPLHISKKQHIAKSVSIVLESSNLSKKEPKRISTQSMVDPRKSTSAKPSNSSKSTEPKLVTKRSIGEGRVSTSESMVSVSSESKMYGAIVAADNNNSSNIQRNEKRALVRVTSSNVMMSGHLGNLRVPGNNYKSFVSNNSPDATMKTIEEVSSIMSRQIQSGNKLGGSSNANNAVMGNIVRQSSGDKGLIRASDPEVFKKIGNEKYREGKFEDALALYDKAITLDSSNATYRSNRSAALLGLGRFIEAVDESCKAITLDPLYKKAHQRLAILYVRFGEAEKAEYHYKQYGMNPDSKEIIQAKKLQKQLNKCVEARKSKEWSTLLKETEVAILSGANSAPQVYAMQAEALLRLQSHEEANKTFQKAPKIPVNSSAKFFGLESTAYLLMIGAQVHMAMGRFEDAVSASKEAVRLDPSNTEASMVAKRARLVASARLSGNLLFKASKFSEASVVYSEGLEHEPFNAILFCNRAACRSKLGQFEKAVEDCNSALSVLPRYSKARLRRADCNAKLERWEAAIQDYEVLKRESPTDEEVGRALFEAQVQLKKQRGEDTKDLKFGSNLFVVSGNEPFRHLVTSPGMCVVLFCNKNNHKKELQLMKQVCKKYPSINFLKVEVEDHPYLAKSEEVTGLPSFKIYKNGSRVKEIPGNNRELLENSVKFYST